MRLTVLIAFIATMAFAQQPPSLVNVVKKAAGDGQFAAATKALADYHAAKGTTPEYLEAYSWIGRAQLAAKNYDAAMQNAAEVRQLCLDELKKRKVDAEPHFPIALGATIEVEAQAMAATGQRSQAVGFLQQEVKQWHDTSMRMRIQKNLNLLTLEGKPAPAIATAEFLPGHKAMTLAQHKGKPMVMFFWAHWCPDCKKEAPLLAQLEKTYASKGLTVIAPTQHYGYVAKGAEAPRDVETAYIGEIYNKFYSEMGNVEVPISEETFANYGVSTTPTVVLVDAKGIVRLYNPGALSIEQLTQKIDAMLATPKAQSEQ